MDSQYLNVHPSLFLNLIMFLTIYFHLDKSRSTRLVGFSTRWESMIKKVVVVVRWNARRLRIIVPRRRLGDILV